MKMSFPTRHNPEEEEETKYVENEEEGGDSWNLHAGMLRAEKEVEKKEK